MVTTIVTNKGQIVIPSRIRHRHGIKNGTRLCIIEKGNEIILQPLTKEYFEHMAGILGGQKKITSKLLEERARDSTKEEGRCRS